MFDHSGFCSGELRGASVELLFSIHPSMISNSFIITCWQLIIIKNQLLMLSLHKKTYHRSSQQIKNSKVQQLSIKSNKQQGCERERGRMWKEMQKNYKAMGNEEKISLVNKNIGHIDVGGNGWGLKIKTLYLSNNNICSLRNLTQFPNLEHLSLSHNDICSITNIRYLQQLLHLTHLSLEVNPVTNHHFYQPYVFGNVPSLKMLDQKPIAEALQQQSLHYWSLFQTYIEQLQNNYLTLIHLFQFFKKKTFHFTIRKAFNLAHPEQNTDLQISSRQMERKISLCLQQTCEKIKNFPQEYVLWVEESLLTDINRIASNGQSFITESGIRSKCPLQNYIASMQHLLQKQENKMEEIKQKIVSKYATSLEKSLDSQNQFLPQTLTKTQTVVTHDYREREEVEKVSEMMRFAQQGQRKEILFCEWKLVAKCLTKMKYFVHTQKIKANSANSLFRMMEQMKLRVQQLTFEKILQQVKISRMMKACYNIEKIASFSLINAFTNLKEANEMQARGEIFLRSLEEKKLLKRIWNSWLTLHKTQKLQKHNKLLQDQLDDRNEKQTRYLDKIKLLEKLLFLTEGKLKAYEENIDLNLQRNDPKLLLQQFELQIKNKRKRNPSPKPSKLPSDQTFKSPSPGKVIRKNYSISMNQENVPNNFFHQRKFNSSQKNLRI